MMTSTTILEIVRVRLAVPTPAGFEGTGVSAASGPNTWFDPSPDSSV